MKRERKLLMIWWMKARYFCTNYAHTIVVGFGEHPIHQICISPPSSSSSFFSISLLADTHAHTNHNNKLLYTFDDEGGNDEITLAFLFLNDITKIVRATQYDAMKVPR